MAVECGTATKFESLLRQFFHTDQFNLVVRDCDRLVGLVTHVLVPLGPDDRTAPYVDIARLTKALHGELVEHTEDSSTVITGHFENEPCTVTIVSSFASGLYQPGRI
jgi:hypothetical protein